MILYRLVHPTEKGLHRHNYDKLCNSKLLSGYNINDVGLLLLYNIIFFKSKLHYFEFNMLKKTSTTYCIDIDLLTRHHNLPHFDPLKIHSCRKHCEKRRNCL